MTRRVEDDAGGSLEAVPLEPGETLEEAVEVGETRIVLTDRRVLAVRAVGSPPYRSVDRGNVGTVGRRGDPNRPRLQSAVPWALLGGGLIAAGILVPFGGLGRPVNPPPGMGFEGLFAAVNAVLQGVGYVDDAFLGLGGLALVWAVVTAGRSVLGRRRDRVITVAGQDPIVVPSISDRDTEDALRELVAAARRPPRGGGTNDLSGSSSRSTAGNDKI